MTPRHLNLSAEIFETPQISQTCNIELDEVEPDLFEATIKGFLIVVPSCLRTDISEAMKAEKISGHVDRIHFTAAPKELSI